MIHLCKIILCSSFVYSTKEIFSLKFFASFRRMAEIAQDLSEKADSKACDAELPPPPLHLLVKVSLCNVVISFLDLAMDHIY